MKNRSVGRLHKNMKVIAKLDIGHSEIVNHFDPEFVKMICGWKIHD